MKKSMLEYTKTVLQKVSFDRNLFEKEFRKASKNLLHHEMEELKQWAQKQYGGQFSSNEMR